MSDESKRLPTSAAARFATILELVNGIPEYCDCNEFCTVVVARGEPLITKEQAFELMKVAGGGETP